MSDGSMTAVTELQMAGIVSINFGSDDIRVVFGACRAGSAVIERAFRLTDQQLDDFLSVDNCEAYVVSTNLEERYQDIITLPPATEKYFDRLVINEMRRLHPDLNAFSCFYEIIGDAHLDGKLFKKTACFIYDSSELSPLIARFSRHHKRISHLFSSAYALGQLVANSSAATTEPILCVESLSGDKSVFLLDNSKIYFVRHIQSNSAGIDATDAQHINMTIDHCFQSLRVKPRSVVLLDSEEAISCQASDITLPLQPGISCEAVRAEPGILWPFAAPIAALACSATSSSGNILPQYYRDQVHAMEVLKKGTYMLAILCLLVFAAIVKESFALLGAHQSVTRQRTALKGIDQVVAEYSQVNDEFKQKAQLIAAVNNASAQALSRKQFSALNCLASPGIHPTSVILNKKEGNRLSIEVKGELKEGSYATMQAAYERLIANIINSRELEIISRKMDPLLKTFNLELLYKG